VRVAPLRDATDAIVGTLAVALDITERQQAEAALRASERRYRTLLDTAHESIWVIDAEDRTTYVNHRMAGLLGYQPEEMLGRPAYDFTETDQREEAHAQLEQRRQGIAAQFDFPLVHNDGSQVWVRSSASALTADDGSYAGAVAMMTDITAERRHEEIRAFLEEVSSVLSASLEYDATLTAILDLLVPRVADWCALDLLHEDGRVERVGERNHYPAHQAALEELRRHYNPSQSENWRVRQVMRTGKLIFIERVDEQHRREIAGDERHLRLVRALGTRSLITVPLVARGRMVGALWLGTDHSGRSYGPDELALAEELARRTALAVENARLYRLEREARADAEAESLYAADLARRLVDVQEAERRAIALELHDEIGQLLTGLKLTLESGGPAGGPAHASALAQTNDLIERVRDLSLTLRPALLDDLGLLPALHWLVQRYMARTGIVVTLAHQGVNRRFPVRVESSAYRIVQEALTNVARHADTSRAIVRLWADAESLGVQVEDQGAGFDPARPGPKSSGLAGIQERAALLGGRVEVEAAPGAGTRLTAELPLGGPAERHGEEEPACP
jgi:PAS domain S-box-containing protein